MFYNKISKALAIAILLMCVVDRAFAQFYVSDWDGFLWKVAVTGNNVTPIQVKGCGEGQYQAITISENTIYYVDLNGDLSRGDITNEPTITNCQLIATGVSATALTIDNNGILYLAVGNALYSLDPTNPLLKLLGIMPYVSAGDLTFYDNDLYMASTKGIVKVSLTDPSQSTLHIPILNQPILALSTIRVSNGPDKIYALMVTGNNTNVFELDIFNQRVLPAMVGMLPFIAGDSASGSESGSSPGIKIDSTTIVQKCDAFNKATVQVYCRPGAGTFTYSLANGPSNTTGIFDNLAPGDYQVTITSDGTERPKQTSFTVPRYDIEVIDLFITPTLTNPWCNRPGKIKLDAGKDNTRYKIRYEGNVFDFDHTFTGLSAGNHHFAILKANGCIASERNYMLQQQACPPFGIDSVTVKAQCDQYGRATISVYTGAPPESYTYTLGNNSNITGVFNLVSPGSYTLTVVSPAGERKEQAVIVPDFTLDKPIINYSLKNAACAIKGQIKFSISGNDKGASKIKYGSTLYKFNESIPGVSPGQNRFMVLNKQGCIIDQFDIDVTQDGCQAVSFPNAFTPNNDGVNDIFRPNLDSNPSNYRLTLYNRLGQLIFTTENLLTGWDGNLNGKTMPSGVYYWLATYKTNNGQVTQKGYVALIR